MNRAAIENMAMLKKMIQSALDSGEINDRGQLLAVAAEHGLTVTRNGRDYAGFMTKGEKRFRVRFEFNDYLVKAPRVARSVAQETRVKQECPPVPSPEIVKRGDAQAAVDQPLDLKKRRRKSRNPTTGFWIYALFAHSKDGERKACYVGQSARITKRFREHFRQRREGHGSSALFRWAAHEQVEIQAVVLTWTEGTQSNATYFEGYWLQRALNAGFEAPDVHNWGNLPRPDSLPGQPMLWPTELVQARSISLVEIVMQKLAPKVIYLDAQPTGMIQLGLCLTPDSETTVDRFV